LIIEEAGKEAPRLRSYFSSTSTSIFREDNVGWPSKSNDG